MDKTLLKRIERGLGVFSDAEDRLANYIVNHSNDVVSMSIAQLAETSDVSVATVVRFARKMGADGFSDFKIRLSASLATDSEHEIDTSAIERSDSIEEIFTKLSSYASKSIEDTYQLLDMPSLEKAVDTLAATKESAGKIFVLGVGASAPLAMQANLELGYLGYSSVLFPDLYLNIESMLMSITENDVLLVVSTLGKSTYVHKAIEIAHQAHAKTILISQFITDYIGEPDTITLLTANSASDFELINTTALVTEGIVIHALYYGLATRDYKNQVKRMHDLEIKIREIGM